MNANVQDELNQELKAHIWLRIVSFWLSHLKFCTLPKQIRRLLVHF